MLDDEKVDKLIGIEGINGICNYTPTNICSAPVVPISFKALGAFGHIKSSYKQYSDYYIEYLQWLSEFEIMDDEEYYYIKCEQKN